MAMPIAVTPVLTRKEAKKFKREALRNVNRSVSKKEAEIAERDARIFIEVVKKQTKNVMF
ncbi:MAG: hypothetical protein LBL00_04290 [Endomicrobium sp.]|jgi:hypothetical protein|nr:hypothetical protein [Endomicrobium sp.]